jgi:hypothetical protein
MDYDPRDSDAQNKVIEKQYKIGIQKREAENSLYALVFNNEAGKRLLGKWVEEYVHTWIAQPNATQIGVGIKQGQANFVMDIKTRLKQIEKGVENG